MSQILRPIVVFLFFLPSITYATTLEQINIIKIHEKSAIIKINKELMLIKINDLIENKFKVIDIAENKLKFETHTKETIVIQLSEEGKQRIYRISHKPMQSPTYYKPIY